VSDSCRRVLEIEIPPKVVAERAEAVARELQRHARLAGFRPGKAPISLIRQRFQDDIRSQVIQDLVPKFLENQRAHAALILELAASGDFDAARRIAHNMKGTGKGYGFDVISGLGSSIEQAASRSAAEEVEKLAKELSRYLASVQWQPRGRASEA